jgi:integrase
MPRKPRKRQYGSGAIQERRGAGGVTYRIQWRVRRGARRISETYPTRELAQRALDGHRGDAAHRRAGLPTDPARILKLSVLAETWFKEREGPANRNNADEQRKWRNHLEPEIGHMRPDEVTTLHLRTIINAKLKSGRKRPGAGKKAGEGLSSTMVLQLMRILSSLYTHLLEQGDATTNPVRLLPKAVRRKIRPAHDWRNTPFLSRLADARRIYLALPKPANVAFAIGVMRGPRPGEIRALRWPQVDLEHRLLHIQRQVSKGKEGPPKGGRTRTVSISEELYLILAAWQLESGGQGLVIPTQVEGRRRSPHGGGRYICERALGRELARVLKNLELPAITWYQATRHTFGSHWVLQGGSLEKLAMILGHSSSEVTKRYAHLRPELLDAQDTARAQVDLRPGEVVALRSVPGQNERGN